MNFKKTIAYVSVFLIAIASAWYFRKLSSEFSFWIQMNSRSELSPIILYYSFLSIAAVFIALIVHRNHFKSILIFPALVVLMACSVLKSRAQFYEYHDHPNYGDMKNIPECFKEENFNSFIEYLKNGCHLTLNDLMLSQCYKALCWIIVFYLTLFILNRFRKNRRSDHNLIDAS